LTVVGNFWCDKLSGDNFKEGILGDNLELTNFDAIKKFGSIKIGTNKF
jgi:hypothetical protein